MDLDKIWFDFLSKMGIENQPGLWVIEVFIAVFVTLVANLVLVSFLKKVELKFEKTKNAWDDVFIHAVRKPAAIMVWVVGISWATGLVDAESDTNLLSAAEPIRKVAVIMLLAWFLTRLVKGLTRTMTSPERMKTPMDETTAHAVSKLLRASIIITAVLVVLQSLGYSISGVLAFGGIGGIAIGFAAKDLLANFFGGLMVYLDRPFAVGDWVRSPDKEIEGVVEYIGWRQTRIRTFDKRPLYVPNATFTSISVENPSRMNNRRIYEVVGLRYGDAALIQAVVNDVRKMLVSHPDIDQRQTMIVHFNAFNKSSLDFFVYTFTKTTDWVEFHKIKEDVLLKIVAIVQDHGADFAFPTSTVHLPDLKDISGVNLSDSDTRSISIEP